MNERIRDLALEASVKYISSEEWVFTDSELEKFAESIVKQCMTICKNSEDTYLKRRKATDDFQDKNIYAMGEVASISIKHKIQKHFGVK